MSVAAMRSILRTRLNTGSWTAVLIVWDGFNQDESSSTPTVAYFRPRLEEGEDEDVGIGGDLRRRRWAATLVTDYSAPVGVGDATAAADIQALLDRFDRFELDGVVFHRPGFCKDLQSDGVRHLWRVFQPFYYERVV